MPYTDTTLLKTCPAFHLSSVSFFIFYIIPYAYSGIKWSFLKKITHFTYCIYQLLDSFVKQNNWSQSQWCNSSCMKATHSEQDTSGQTESLCLHPSLVSVANGDQWTYFSFDCCHFGCQCTVPAGQKLTYCCFC